ncbi:Protocadherin-8 [Tupaia chinensis]|uniref:Protocadherin-8 n=1 Tax=Tupaia chinensis TaxID=246437 RepID=L9K463_TUPCH|nr:Protocadherin-8 [Tupaia chinensis]
MNRCVALDVVSCWQEQFWLVHVVVEVRDVNDHTPRFLRVQIPVQVSEGATVGTCVPLEVLQDKNMGANHAPCRAAQPLPCGVADVCRRCPVHRPGAVSVAGPQEPGPTYSLELVAQDGGHPPSCATATVSVHAVIAVQDAGRPTLSCTANTASSARGPGATWRRSSVGAAATFATRGKGGGAQRGVSAIVVETCS